MSNFLVPCLVSQEVLLIDTIRAFRIELQSQPVPSAEIQLTFFTISSIVRTSRIKVECAIVNHTYIHTCTYIIIHM